MVKLEIRRVQQGKQNVCPTSAQPESLSEIRTYQLRVSLDVARKQGDEATLLVLLETSANLSSNWTSTSATAAADRVG